MWLCILSGRQSENTFENTQWRKVKQMQPVWVCILWSSRFKDPFENTRWRKVKLKWHMESVESFEYSNNIYSKGYLDVNLRWQNYWSCDGTGDNINIFVFLSLQMRMEDKINCCSVFLQFGQIHLAIGTNVFWTNTFGNWDKYILNLN